MDGPGGTDPGAAVPERRGHGCRSRSANAGPDRTDPVSNREVAVPCLGGSPAGRRAATISAAYERSVIVRGSTLRGTVHTCTPADHVTLDAITRIGNRALWARTMRLSTRSLEEMWAGIEGYAHDDWRTPAELADHVRTWIAPHDPAATPRLDNDAGRYFGFGHAGLLRRPLTGGWQSQGAPGYRTAAGVLDNAQERSALHRASVTCGLRGTRTSTMTARWMHWCRPAPQAFSTWAARRAAQPPVAERGRGALCGWGCSVQLAAVSGWVGAGGCRRVARAEVSETLEVYWMLP